MNDDIVYDLIGWMFDHPDQDKHTSDLMLRACNEIEKLRGALDYYAERLKSPYAGTGPYDPSTYDPGSVARAALGKEKPFEDRWDNA